MQEEKVIGGDGALGLMSRCLSSHCQLLQVFDSWAGDLETEDFHTFSLPYLEKIAAGVRGALPESSRVPMIGFAKGALGHSIADVVASGYDVIGLDWETDPNDARRATKQYESDRRASTLGHRIALQGNMNPDVLLQGREDIEKTVKSMCQDGFGGSGAYIANLGHGITPGVDPENMRFFLECVHKYSREAANND
jgi:uroporphyrinogen decarboxylase